MQQMSDAFAKVMRLDLEEGQEKLVRAECRWGLQGLSTMPGSLTWMPAKELGLFTDRIWLFSE